MTGRPGPVLCRHCRTTLTLRGARWVSGDDRRQSCDGQDGYPHQPMPYGLTGAPDPAATIRYLTVHQPWAWLIAWGYKDVENRGRCWAAPGLLGIHAGRDLDRQALDHPLVRAAVDHWCGNGYVTGVPPWEQGSAVLAVADSIGGHLRGTVPGCTGPQVCSRWAVDAPGTWHHSFTNLIRIDPVPARGWQGLWTPRDAPGLTEGVLRRRDAAIAA